MHVNDKIIFPAKDNSPSLQLAENPLWNFAVAIWPLIYSNIKINSKLG